MAQSNPARHLALIAFVLLGVFIYAGWRIKSRVVAEQAGQTALSTPKEDEERTLPEVERRPAPPLEGSDATEGSESTTLAENRPALPELERSGDVDNGLHMESDEGKTADSSAMPVLPVIGGNTSSDETTEVELKDDRTADELSQWEEPPENKSKDEEATKVEEPVLEIERLPSGVERKYTVKKGDTLWKIASSQLGHGDRWGSIFEANRDVISGPASLKPGMELKIPAGGKLAEEKKPASGVAAADSKKDMVGRDGLSLETRHTVAKGDTLSSISQKYYRKKSLWKKIYAANRGVIADCNRLKVGTVITIPAER